ncbi:hypothetical protein CH64_505 [Yersinia rohdei]|uniref:Lipoprotein n=1 Tax=Yersinia rohdei TaxID=29485 RepID=A0ABM5SGS8_YERRO|nr:hypothetical protein [Yersinia rohdei]AJJ12485.1 hypothetical protein CH64_505 [Yersinia rohdei]EEQ02118.1 hypothetical protein yrohd0001_32370 [Yersinia rohdei ATCC 43380]CNI28595.1 Uncharacterised protein [Yersinia rohdei]
MKKSLLTTSAAILFVVGTGFSSLTYACSGPHSHYGDICEQTCGKLSQPWKTFCYFGGTQQKTEPASQVTPGMGTLTPAMGILTPSKIPMIPLEK